MQLNATDRALVWMLRSIVIGTALIFAGIVSQVVVAVVRPRVSPAEHKALQDRVEKLERILPAERSTPVIEKEKN
jgi:hypothetical protein